MISFLLHISRLVSDLDMKVLDFQEFGKEAVKRLKCSPDSFIQMGIQLTFNKMHQVPAATYERYHPNITLSRFRSFWTLSSL